MYAIVRTGGKQYRVEEGRTLSVELLPAKEGSSVELKDVLLIDDDGKVTLGTPTIDGARVLADVESHGRAKKIIVFKYRAKVRTRKKTGHRQHLTNLAVTEILRPGQESKVAKPKRRRAKAAVKDADAEVSASVAATDDKPAPKRRTRRAAPATAKATAAKAGADDKPAAKRTRKAAAPKAKAGTAEKAAPKRRTRKAATPKASSAKAAATDTDEKAAADEPVAEAKASAKPARKRTSRAKAPAKTDEDKE